MQHGARAILGNPIASATNCSGRESSSRTHRAGRDGAGRVERSARMIGYLQGSLKHLDATTALVLTNGVGYEVRISLQTYYKLEGQREASLEIYTHVREDALALYGFASSQE